MVSKYGLYLCTTFFIFLIFEANNLASQTKEVKKSMRGVWLTNIASDVLWSKKNIENAVNLCDSLGFNNIFVVTWNNASTTYPSMVMEKLIGVKIQKEFYQRDPLKELISYAHSKNIKVHAWFEFGFSCSYKDIDGGPIIKAKPHWASKDKNGKLCSKNGFQWMNAFHPEVQEFLTSLIMEVISNYDIDGIQGDDRLPALPSLGGYDDYTTKLYKSENQNQSPPRNEKDYQWIKWRSDKLSEFLRILVKKVRDKNPNLLISMAPSIYPWSEQEYLQNWPQWLNEGLLDFVVPQVYRYKFDSYEKELDKIIASQVHSSNKNKVYPGILLQVDKYNPTELFLKQMVEKNRSLGLNGEVYFFYEGVKKFKKYFNDIYKK